jgi:hypothetical protein
MPIEHTCPGSFRETREQQWNRPTLTSTLRRHAHVVSGDDDDAGARPADTAKDGRPRGALSELRLGAPSRSQDPQAASVVGCLSHATHFTKEPHRPERPP